MLRDALELLGGSVARYYDVEPGGSFAEVGLGERVVVPALASEMEAELLPRALARGKSLISSHPLLDADLTALVELCRAARITTHVLPVRAHQQAGPPRGPALHDAVRRLNGSKLSPASTSAIQQAREPPAAKP